MRKHNYFIIILIINISTISIISMIISIITSMIISMNISMITSMMMISVLANLKRLVTSPQASPPPSPTRARLDS